MSGTDDPDQVSAYASLAAETIGELRDLVIKNQVPMAVEQERMIAVKAVSDAQQQEIANLREENEFLQKSVAMFCQNAAKRMAQIGNHFAELFARVVAEQNERMAKIEESLERVRRRKPVAASGGVPDGQVRELAESLRQKEAEVRELKAKMNHDADLVGLMQQVDDFTRQAVTLEGEKRQLEIENQRLTETLKNTENAKSVLNSANLDLNARIEELELRLSSSPELASTSELNDRIAQLSQSLDSLQKSHSQQVEILNEQVKMATEHAKSAAAQLSEGNERNVELAKALRTTEMELNMAKRQVMYANSQLDDCKRELESQREQNEVLKSQKAQIAGEFDALLEQRNSMNQETEMFVKSLVDVFGCSSEDVAPRISEMLNELARLKQYLSKSGEQERELCILKSTNHSLEERVKALQDQMESQDQLIRVCKDGKESEAVKGIHEQFKKLQDVNSQLIKEIDSNRTQLFSAESALNSTKAALDDERSLNTQLSSKVERFEFYEYSIGQLISVLESLSSQIVLSLNKTSGEIERQQALDGLLVELKKQNSTPQSAQAKWDKFLSAMQMTMVDNSALMSQLMEGKLNSCKEGFMALLEKNLRSMRERISLAHEHLDIIKQKASAPALVPAPRRQIPVKRRSLYEPMQKPAPAKENRYMERSPVTPVAHGKGGITPRV